MTTCAPVLPARCRVTVGTFLADDSRVEVTDGSFTEALGEALGRTVAGLGPS